jgi:hypothetical protein
VPGSVDGESLVRSGRVIVCGAVAAWSEVAAIADAAEREEARAMLREAQLRELTQDQETVEGATRAVGLPVVPRARPPRRETAVPDLSDPVAKLSQLMLEEFARVERTLIRIETGVNEIAKVAGIVHDQLQRWTFSYETISGTPRFFTLTPVSKRGLGKAAFWQDTYQLTLWCEHDDKPHRWLPAQYPFHKPRDWWITVAPYALVVLKTLRLVVNVAAPIATLPIAALADVDLESVKDDLDAMDRLLGQLPSDIPDALAASSQSAQFIQADGPELRALRALLTELDPNRNFNGMHVVATSSGDIRWVCQDHYAAYDPRSYSDEG